MAITLKLNLDEGELVVSIDHQTVKTALEKIPAIQNLQADPFTNGQVLTAAPGGGDEMLKRLADDPENLILLDCDDKADAFAWEFATLPDRQFLCVKAGMLRTVPRNVPPGTSNGALNFIALAADPLVDEGGNSRERYRLDLDNEMRSIRETLQNSGKNLTGRRIPPTREHFNRALRQGPAVLHLTCHGNVQEAARRAGHFADDKSASRLRRLWRMVGKSWIRRYSQRPCTQPRGAPFNGCNGKSHRFFARRATIVAHPQISMVEDNLG
jgi:hypothetical protein